MMNHRQGKIYLKSLGAQEHTGIVITPPMDGPYTHVVFLSKEKPLYLMPESLFKCRNSQAKTTLRAKIEEPLMFGDEINFTTIAEESDIVADFYKAHKMTECEVLDGKYLLKSILMISPDEIADKLWCHNFGDIGCKKLPELRKRLLPDVPVHAWIQFQCRSPTQNEPARLKILFHSICNVCDDANGDIYYNPPWHKNIHQKVINLNNSESSEDDVRMEQEDSSHVMKNLEGFLISRNEIFCFSNKQRFYIGMLSLEDVENPPLGHIIKFKAHYNQRAKKYIAFEYQVRQHFLNVRPANNEPINFFSNEQTFHIEAYPTINLKDYGAMLKDQYIGLISDRENFFNALPYTVSSGDYVKVWVQDQGDESFVRFKVIDLPPETEKQRKIANKEMEKIIIDGEGVVIGDFVYYPKQPTISYYYTEKKFPIGTWIRFKAKYSSELLLACIIWVEQIHEKSPLECRLIKNEYLYLIDVEYHREYKTMLWNPIFGFVSDPNNKCKRFRYRKRVSVIVKQDKDNYAETLFTVHCLNEAGDGRRRCAFSCALDEEEIVEELTGLATTGDYESVTTAISQQQNLTTIPQALHNSKFSIRERRLRAAERKRQRKRDAEAMDQLEENFGNLEM